MCVAARILISSQPLVRIRGHLLIGAMVHDPAVATESERPIDALESYARNPRARHAPVWRAWNRLASDDCNGAGIWHETFKVAAGSYEAIYQNVPVIGLQRAGRPLTVTEAKDSARARITS